MLTSKTKKKSHHVWLWFLLPLLLIALALLPDRKPTERTVSDGVRDIFLTPISGLPASPFHPSDFTTLPDGTVTYTGSTYETLQGVDVSDWQGEIDWQQVAESGIDFAYIRCAYRSYGIGELRTDPCFEANLSGAADAGLQRGVYFFSQALSPEEAREEAAYVLSLLSGRQLDLPVIFDWEDIPHDEARTDDMEAALITDCAKAFCDTIRQGGYEAGIYFNLQMGYHIYDLSHFKDTVLWLAEPGNAPTFYYHTALWQYDHHASVPGISTSTDRNLLFVKKS